MKESIYMYILGDPINVLGPRVTPTEEHISKIGQNVVVGMNYVANIVR